MVVSAHTSGSLDLRDLNSGDFLKAKSGIASLQFGDVLMSMLIIAVIIIPTLSFISLHPISRYAMSLASERLSILYLLNELK